MSTQHYHNAYEFYLQLDGKRYVFYDNICYTLQRGDLAIFNPFDIHYAQSRESDYYERYVLNFHEDDLSILLSDEERHTLLGKIHPCVMHLTEQQTMELYGHFERTNGYSRQTGFLSEKVVYASLLQLILYVVSCIDDTQLTQGSTVSPQMIKVLEYINTHYKECITLDRISDVACMSKYHFCRTFKKVTGATVLEYLNNIRLSKVHSLLLDTKYSIEEIAQEAGFSSAVNVARAFKKAYGMSPRTFRKENAVDREV